MAKRATLRQTGTPAELGGISSRVPSFASTVGAVPDVRQVYRYKASELFLVGPLNKLGEWVPFTRGNRYETIKGVSAYGNKSWIGAGPWPIPNDPAGKVVDPGDLTGFVFQLVDADGVPYVESVPLKRIVPGAAVADGYSTVSGGPAGYNVQPIRTQMWSGGVKLVDPALLGLGINFYVPVEVFYV